MVLDEEIKFWLLNTYSDMQSWNDETKIFCVNEKKNFLKIMMP